MADYPDPDRIRSLVRDSLLRLVSHHGSPAAERDRLIVDAAALSETAPGSTVNVPAGALITPLARDVALERDITLVQGQPHPGVLPTPERSIALGADHGGYRLKEQLKAYIPELGWQPVDCGTHSTESVDYPDYAYAVAALVSDGRVQLGIIVDGAGIGSCMVANKVPGVRAALCYDQASAANSREHNHANVLTLGAGLIGPNLARLVVKTWLETPCGPGRHAQRVDKIMQVERRFLRK